LKFFKHFTDSHRGKSMLAVKRKLGTKGIGAYWILVELCAEKLDKGAAELFDESHCSFEFDTEYLRDTLQTHQLKNLEMYLRCYGDVGLMSHQSIDDVTTIYMPKLLECLDRDSKRARTQRDHSAPKIKSKRKRKIEEGAGDFDSLLMEPEAGTKPTTPPPTEPKPNQTQRPSNQTEPPIKRKPPANMMQSAETAAAELIWAVEHFDSGTKGRVELQEYLGPHLWKLALNLPGGLNGLRMMKRDDTYRHRNVAGMLKDAAQRLGMEVS